MASKETFEKSGLALNIYTRIYTGKLGNDE